MTPYFSIITATYNSAGSLARCLRSVAGQEFEAAEHIVVDGGSRDGTLDVIRAHERQIARWISEPDGGIYDAWNKGVALARGEWILFLGADDRLASDDVLEAVRGEIARRREGHPIAYGRVRVVDPATGREVARHGRPWERMKGDRKGLKPAAPSNAGTFFHRSLFEGKDAPFDTSYRVAADYKFVLQALRRGGEPLWVDRLVAVMDGEGASSRPGVQKYREEVRMLRELGIPFSTARRLYMGFRAYATTFLYRLLGARIFGRLASLWRSLRSTLSQTNK